MSNVCRFFADLSFSKWFRVAPNGKQSEIKNQNYLLLNPAQNRTSGFCLNWTISTSVYIYILILCKFIIIKKKFRRLKAAKSVYKNNDE